jgi:pyrimidine operon attenuation protein/uracil phosphoribosyltransferase
MSPPENETVLSAPEIAAKLREMGAAITEIAGANEGLVLVGIQRRGVNLAARLAKILEPQHGDIPLGAVDITLYRDDLGSVGPKPVVGETRIPFELEGKFVVVVDDVLYTGRTVRAALNTLSDYGRPDRIALCVLVDRGGRELPIHADVVGYSMSADRKDRVDVYLEEVDGRDAVELSTGWRT